MIHIEVIRRAVLSPGYASRALLVARVRERVGTASLRRSFSIVGVGPGRSICYHSVAVQMERLRGGLRDRGRGKEEHVGILVEPKDHRPQGRRVGREEGIDGEDGVFNGRDRGWG